MMTTGTGGSAEGTLVAVSTLEVTLPLGAVLHVRQIWHSLNTIEFDTGDAHLRRTISGVDVRNFGNPNVATTAVLRTTEGDAINITNVMDAELLMRDGTVHPICALCTQCSGFNVIRTPAVKAALEDFRAALRVQMHHLIPSSNCHDLLGASSTSSPSHVSGNFADTVSTGTRGPVTSSPTHMSGNFFLPVQAPSDETSSNSSSNSRRAMPAQIILVDWCDAYCKCENGQFYVSPFWVFRPAPRPQSKMGYCTGWCSRRFFDTLTGGNVAACGEYGGDDCRQCGKLTPPPPSLSTRFCPHEHVHEFMSG